MSAMYYYHSPELPWSPTLAEERRFRVIAIAMLVGFTVVTLLVASLNVPPIDRFQAETLPPRLAKLVIKEKPKPPPPPERKPEPKVEKKKPEPQVEEKRPKPEIKKKVLKPDVAAARKKAARSGLLALSNELASLRQNDLGDLVKNTPLTKADPKAEIHRSIITSQAAKGSGGISTAQLSRDPGQTRLASRSTTTVESDDLVAARQAAEARRNGRSTEEIQLILDRNKGALYALYHRALRANPALQGKVVLEITIAPSGEVTDCKVVSAELADKDLIRKLVARIRLISFGAKKVEATVFTWPIDFLPSS